MVLQLWKRESRGAQRQLWLQPWTVPVVVLVVAGLINGEVVPPVRRWDLPLGLGTLVLDWPEVVLAVWITWVVIHAIARERGTDWVEQLAVTPISHAEIIRAKTFAPAMISLIALAVVRSTPILDGDESVMADLGLDTRIYTYDMRHLAMTGAALVYLVLTPLFIATLASRVGTRIRMPSFAFGVSILLMICVLMGVRYLHAVDRWLIPLCGAVVIIYAVALMDSKAMAICLVLVLWLIHMRFAAANLEGRHSSGYYGLGRTYMSRITQVLQSTGFREVASYIGAPIICLIVAFRGHDRPASFIAVGALGFFTALEIQISFDSDGILGATSVLPLVVFGFALWHIRWRRWTSRSFWKIYSREV